MSIYKKLFQAKKEIGKISKDSKNPFFKSSYLSLNGLIEAVEDVLEKHDLLLIQPIMDGKVRTIICLSETDGEKLDNVYSEMELPNITDPQKLGSAITYFRRYTLEALLGLKAEDDDGNKAAKKTPIDVNRLHTKLESCTEISQLASTYEGFTKEERKATVAKKEEMKTKLSK